jgi:hypothetical protein
MPENKKRQRRKGRGQRRGQRAEGKGEKSKVRSQR